ncbi:MAG: hypothetical protein ACYS8Y_11395, partial [Planctomycetota bacterium]
MCSETKSKPAFLGAMKMTLKDIWSKTITWLREHNPFKSTDYEPQIDSEGLISQDVEQTEPAEQAKKAESKQVMVKTVQPTDKSASIEKLQTGFDNLINQLQGINEHLNRHATQTQDLMQRIDRLPELLEKFPSVVENQKQLTEQMLEQLKAATEKNQQFIETIEKIPNETAKQTDALTNIDHQLSAAADIDVQMTESFNKFNETLDKLDQSTLGQTDGIM